MRSHAQLTEIFQCNVKVELQVIISSTKYTKFTYIMIKSAIINKI